jgi:hypothetical protein
MASAAYDRFIDSMTIGFEQWHDGGGYDLGALAETTAREKEHLETVLRAKVCEDWRVIEALAALGTTGARSAIRLALKAADPVVRLAAAAELHRCGELRDLTDVVVHALRSGNSSAFSRAIDLIGWERVTGATPELLQMCVSGSGEEACHSAAMLYFLHGLAKEAFDWDHRPFFLRFNTDDAREREAAFGELCEKLGVRPDRYVRAGGSR